MTKMEVLAWGMKHIASNYGFDADIDYEKEGSMCIYGGCKVPMLSDVYMLCDDLGIPHDNISSNDFGVDVEITFDWTQDGGLLQENYVPTGMETWKRHYAVIGGSLGFKTEWYDTFEERGQKGLCFPTIEAARDWCREECERISNPNLIYCVRDAGKDWTAPSVYVCELRDGKVTETTEEWNKRNEEE